MLFAGSVVFACFFISCKTKQNAVSSRNIKSARPPGSADKEALLSTLYVNGCSERMKGNLQPALKLFEECRALDPANAAVSYELGTIYKLLGNTDMAVAYAKQSAGSDPMNEWYQLLLVDCYNSKRQYAEAIKVREKLVKNFPGKADFKEDLAIEYALVGDYDKSLKLYDQIEAAYGTNEQLLLNKVKLLKSMKRLKEAEGELNKLAASKPDESRFIIYLADFYLEAGEGEKARQTYEKVLQMDPMNPTVNLALHDYYKSKNNEAKAYEALTRAFENPDLDAGTKANILSEFYKDAEAGNADALKKGLELARITVKEHPSSTEASGTYADFLRLNKNNPEAVRYYYRAASNERKNYRIWRNLLYMDNEFKLFDSLEHHSAQCIEIFPNQPEGYLLNGVANLKLGAYKKAVMMLNDGMEFVMSSPDLRLDFLKTLGDANNYLKDYAASDKAFDEALKIDPDNTYVLNNYAYFLSMRGEKLDFAEKFAKRVNQIRPDNTGYMDTYGWVLYKQKKYTEAEDWLSKAAKGTTDAEVLEHYGDVLFRLGKKDEAQKMWERAKNGGAKTEVLEKKLRTKKLDD